MQYSNQSINHTGSTPQQQHETEATQKIKRKGVRKKWYTG